MEIELEAFRSAQVEETSRVKTEVHRSAQISSQSGSKKFDRSTLQKEIHQTPQHTYEHRRQLEKEEVMSVESKEGSPAFEGNKTWKATMTLKVFLDNEPTEELVTIVMLKVIDAIQE